MSLRVVSLALKLALTLAPVMLAGCASRATEQDCQRIFERIVELELVESGYRDPALLSCRRAELRTHFGELIRRCADRKKRPDLDRCMRAAKSAEHLVHRCL